MSGGIMSRGQSVASVSKTAPAVANHISESLISGWVESPLMLYKYASQLLDEMQVGLAWLVPACWRESNRCRTMTCFAAQDLLARSRHRYHTLARIPSLNITRTKFKMSVIVLHPRSAPRNQVVEERIPYPTYTYSSQSSEKKHPSTDHSGYVLSVYLAPCHLEISDME